MRIFLTGATGFIGSALVPELIKAGHHVIGMTRSNEGAKALLSAGAEVHLGTLEDLDTLRAGADKADGVIHAAFDHDFNQFLANCEKDRRAIAALGSALAGSHRPLVITSGTGMGSGAHGEPAKEDVYNADHPNPRKASEEAAQVLLDAGINVSVMRLPQVHNPLKQGLISPLIAIAREKGVCAYVGEGLNRFPAAHVLDVAHLYRLAIEAGNGGIAGNAGNAGIVGNAGARYHAVAEEGVTSREITEALGRGLNLPVVSLSPDEVAAHFGWMAMFVGVDMPASSAQTRASLGWHPTGPTLIADLNEARYV